MHKYKDAWQKRYLVPCWVLQILCSIIYGILSGMIVVLFATVARKTKGADDEVEEVVNQVATVVAVASGVILGFCVLTIIFAIVEIVLYAKKRLNPVLALVFAVIKTAYWLCWFIFAIATAVRSKPSAGDIILSFLLFVTSFIQLVLSARFTHLKRRGHFDNTMYSRASGGLEAASLTSGPVDGVYYPDSRSAKQATAYEAYRGHSPAPSTYAAFPGAPKGNYYDHDMEMRPQKPAQM